MAVGLGFREAAVDAEHNVIDEYAMGFECYELDYSWLQTLLSWHCLPLSFKVLA